MSSQDDQDTEMFQETQPDDDTSTHARLTILTDEQVGRLLFMGERERDEDKNETTVRWGFLDLETTDTPEVSTVVKAKIGRSVTRNNLVAFADACPQSYDHALITGKRNDRDSGIDFTITALTNKTKRLFLISSSHSTSMSYPAAQPLRDKDHISIPQYSPERVPTTLKFYDLSAPDRKLLLRDYTPSQHKHSSITNENNTFQVFKRNGKYYAVKQLIANTREGVLKAEKEIMAMQRLSTETGDCRVAPFHDYFFNQDQTYDLIFEYFPGMTLRFLITSRHGLSEKLTKHLMRALLDTVMELHKLQILHCHLTSENVLVDVDGKIQIVNFGSSIYLDGRPALAKGALSNPADTFAAESPFRANPITVSQPFTFSDDVSQCGQICWECFAGDRLCTETTVEQCVLGQDKEQNDITLSTNGRNFVLNACVGYFPTAKSALQHPWFSSHDLADKYTRGPKMF